ncbi:hypothetical protein AJ80_04712 [Polytolypa hystricis UAMH7299]|uniref:Uncharacterized protein n=1 Tax=Polytolypa hystricis (strain UAMH7299) TaxID=1447883 RepID=A0A2B7Y0W3_POLH7|nr:hypothetical protein AJ80_04712 [Polytolypa hystricis UAMH7299]
MPVKWTPDTDQILLLKIIETHDLSVDTKRVAEAWPKTDPKQIPTPRAISERIGKIKSIAKANGATFTPKRGGAKTATPRKAANDNATTKTPPSAKRSLVLAIKDEVSMLSIKPDPETSPNKRVRIKEEDYETDESLAAMEELIARTPSKRAKRTPALPAGMTIYANETEEDEDGEEAYESSGSEFVAGNGTRANGRNEAENDDYTVVANDDDDDCA